MTDPATISAIVMGIVSVVGAISIFFNRLHIKKCISCCCNCECTNSNPPSRINSSSNNGVVFNNPKNSITSL